MSHKLQLLSSYLDSLSIRERIMVLLIAIAILYAVFDNLLFKKLEQNHQQLQLQKQEFADQQQALTAELLNSAQKIAENKRKSVAINQQIDHAQQQLQDTGKQLDSVLDKLVPPTKITELLRNLLLKTNGLKLVSLNNEPVKLISLNTQNIDEADSTQPELFLYQHTTVINLTGNYQQLYQYLSSLEESDWGLFWDQMHYTVTDYPRAKISLRVHTISTDNYWIGL